MIDPSMAGAGVGAVGGVVGGLFGSSAAQKQIKAMREAIAYQKQRDAEAQQREKPYLQFGEGQLNKFGDWLESPESDPMSFLDPGYDFRRQEGMKSITGNAATAGMLQSGDTLRALDQYGQDMASSEYGNAFNRRMQEGEFQRGNIGIGTQASGRLGGLLQQGAANVGGLTADTDWGGPQKVWGDVASGIGGMSGNALSRYMARGSAPPVAGSNVFAPSKYATTPYYNA